jgi:large subunit ribosomal protein L18
MKRIIKNRHHLKKVRHARVRAVLKGTAAIPRVSVFRGNSAMEVQLIDDKAGLTLCAARTKEVKVEKIEGKSTKVALGYAAGKLLAERALAKGIKKAVFDRSGYRYHGRIAAVAEGARAGGLVF